jgi:hypothetical protein
VPEWDTAANTGQLLGPLAFKRKLLERSGWEVKYLLMKDLQVGGGRGQQAAGGGAACLLLARTPRRVMGGGAWAACLPCPPRTRLPERRGLTSAATLVLARSLATHR